MESHPRISELLVKTGAYRDLDDPVILTSGELGIYYVNSEKLVQDKGQFEKYQDDSKGMIEHALKMANVRPSFQEVIDVISEKAQQILQFYEPDRQALISGGQRRDWLFSGPVAFQLDIPHISVYKDGEIEILGPEGGTFPPFKFSEARVLHIVDLLTEGSSCYGKEDREKGWIPAIRQTGANIRDLMAVVTRLQGGEENLKKQGVDVESLVAIDEDFLRQNSKNPGRALAYMRNPHTWSRDYLMNNGALSLVETFSPQGGKLDRARKFLDRYGDFLSEADRWNELDKEINKRYGVHLGNISGDVD